jgi:ribosomal protein L37AE/L43A
MFVIKIDHIVNNTLSFNITKLLHDQCYQSYKRVGCESNKNPIHSRIASDIWKYFTILQVHSKNAYHHKQMHSHLKRDE